LHTRALALIHCCAIRAALTCVLVMVAPTPKATAAEHHLFIDGQDIGIRGRYKACLDEANGATDIVKHCVEDEFTFQESRLNRAYQAALSAASTPEKDSLRTEERSWVKWRDAICAVGPGTDAMAALGSKACSMRQAAVQATALEDKGAPMPRTPSASESEVPLSGVWSREECRVDGEQGPDGCTSFHLTLFEHDGFVCGMHAVATPRLARIDEGEPASVVGATTGRGTALVNIVSGRTGNTYLASLRRSGDKMSWTIVGPVAEAKDGESSMLPLKVKLTRNRSLEAADELARFKKTCKWPN